MLMVLNFETNLAFKEAIQRARKGKGPSVIISNVVRLLAHSSSDDQRKYRDERSLSKDLKKDPLKILESKCLDAGFLDNDELGKIKARIEAQVDSDAKWAESQQYPEPSTALDYIYSGGNSFEDRATKRLVIK